MNKLVTRQPVTRHKMWRHNWVKNPQKGAQEDEARINAWFDGVGEVLTASWDGDAFDACRVRR